MKPSLTTPMSRIFVALVFFLSFADIQINAQDLNPADWPHLKGYWKFQDTTNLTKATVGNDLILVGGQQWVPGAFYGDTAVRIDTGSYYKCYHGIAPNGGGDSVNQYTLMFDFKVLSLRWWHCFFQTDSTNQNDGECFIKHWGDSIAGSIGVGHTGYSSDSIDPNVWYRLVITANLGHFYNYYLNGQLLHIGDTEDIYVDSRFALTPQVLFFADNNHEDDTIDIASVAIFDTCLTPAQIAQLGGLDPCIANPPSVSLGNDTTLFRDDTIHFNVGNQWKTILWSTGDTLPQIAVDSSMVDSLLWVKVTDMNGCDAYDTVKIMFSINTGIADTGIPQVKIYPNPAKFVIYLELNRNADIVEIKDITGKLVLRRQNISKGKHRYNVAGMEEGIYFIVIHTASGVVNQKVIIKK